MNNQRVHYRAWFFLLLMVSLPFGTVAQPTARPDSVAVAPDDRSPVQLRQPRPDALRELQTDRAYRYDNEPPPPDNPLAKLWAWFWQRINQFLQSKAYENVWQYVLMMAVAALILYLLRKADVLGALFPGRGQTLDLPYEQLDENIHAIDFGASIDEAVEQRQYRLAVRLLYLHTLKRLADEQRIDYKPDKTNRQYVSELTGFSQQAPFERLTGQFELVWYGNFPVDEPQFNLIRAQFDGFWTPTAAEAR